MRAADGVARGGALGRAEQPQRSEDEVAVVQRVARRQRRLVRLQQRRIRLLPRGAHEAACQLFRLPESVHLGAVQEGQACRHELRVRRGHLSLAVVPAEAPVLVAPAEGSGGRGRAHVRM